jgi:hypothetical protein
MSNLNNVDIGYTIPDVGTWLSTLNDYAHSAISNASSLASGLNNISPPVPVSNVIFTPLATTASIGNPTRPTAPVINTGTKGLPASPSISAPVLTSTAPPVFTATQPTISFPGIPQALNMLLPQFTGTIKTDFVYPTAPNSTLPTVPTLLSLNIPTAQAFNMPLFDQIFPTSSDIRVPDITFQFNEKLYSDALLDDVKNVLIYRLQGATGLPPAVEQGLWNRGQDRENRQSLMAERTLLVDRASVGFSRPTGAMASQINLIVQETQSKLIDLSREIMIKQAELEQENLKATIQQTIALEDILVRQNNNINQRAFEVARYAQEVAIEIYKARISLYQMQVAAYQAFATAYNYKVQAELAKVEIFKAQIDAEKLKGTINEQNIRIYVSQIEAIKESVEIYKALVMTISEQLKAEELKIEIYKEQVTAYGEAVRAKASEYTMYSEQIKGELAKTEVYDSQVKSYATQIQAYATQAEVNMKTAQLGIDVQELNIKKYTADLDAYSKAIQADALIYSSAVDVFKGQSEIYMADIGLGKATAELALKNSENIIEQNKYASNISLENAKLTLAALTASYQVTLEGKKAAGNMYSTIGSSALQAINVSAAVSGQSQLSGSETHSYTNA